MQQVMVGVPDDLAERMKPFESVMPDIIETGIAFWPGRTETVYGELNDIMKTLGNQPTAEEIMSLRASPKFEERINELLEKNRQSGLTVEEQKEWEHFEYVEHLVRMVKIAAAKKLKEQSHS